MINVLIVDDSAFVREVLTKIISEDKELHVVASVPDPYKAVEVLNSEKIDVITLDLEMPRMDGLTFLEKLMSQKPMPVVVCSSIAEEGSDNAIKALELGAVEVITKPKFGLKDFFTEEKERLHESIKSASKTNIGVLKSSLKHLPKNQIKKSSSHLLSQTTNKVIAIGASTGGTIALKEILSKLPKTCTGIVITQHMPEGFTKSFSNSLNSECEIDVRESEDDDKILIGQAIIAMGNTHLKVERSGAYYRCKISNEPHVNRHRPSVDVMFESIAQSVGKNALGILLTGMGKDGALGLKAIKDAGGITIAQNETSCVVYGMPKAAVDIGAAHYILNLDEIVQKIIEFHD
ncbi:MAG TPA: chemotaxis response regulator protein-glutamate methylesterase [Spirochaetota bacterium]|nr:chemotaxis response regulator protein-glutamate methylesterase [Spirochaetota bacterium]